MLDYMEYIRLSVVNDRVVLRRLFFPALNHILTPDDIKWVKDKAITFHLGAWKDFATGMEICMDAVQGRYRRAHAVVLYSHQGYYSNDIGPNMVSYTLRNPSKNNWNISITDKIRITPPKGSEAECYAFTGRTIGFSALRTEMVMAMITKLELYAKGLP